MQADQLSCKSLYAINLGGGPTGFDQNIATFRLTEVLKCIPEQCNLDHRQPVAAGASEKHADPPHVRRRLDLSVKDKRQSLHREA